LSVSVFVRIQQQANDFDMTKLRCEGERQVTVVIAGAWQQSARVLNVCSAAATGRMIPQPVSSLVLEVIQVGL
jgi:hypothetical protein